MSIKADDTIAKCFHHDCLRYITVHQADPFYQRSLHSALEAVYLDFHKHFLSLADQEGPNVYDYCLNKRQIHPQVLRDAPLGCVPSGYDVSPAFEPVLKQLTEALNDAMQDTRKGGRPSKLQTQKVESLQRSLQFVQAKKQDLAEKIAKRENWLTFHYADGTHRFTAIRLRNPFETEKNFAFVSYNPYRAFGLFGLQMFPRGNAQVPVEKLIVTEGEFNTLQLQSLLVKHGEAAKIEFTYLYVSSVGGVNQADYDTIRKVCGDPIFLYDNDSDKDNAGFALVSKAQEFMAVEGATTPNGCSDVDEFILQFKSSEKAWTAIQEMLGSTVTSPGFSPRSRRPGTLRRRNTASMIGSSGSSLRISWFAGFSTTMRSPPTSSRRRRRSCWRSAPMTMSSSCCWRSTGSMRPRIYPATL